MASAEVDRLRGDERERLRNTAVRAHQQAAGVRRSKGA